MKHPAITLSSLSFISALTLAPVVSHAETPALIEFKQMSPETALKAAEAALQHCRDQGYQVAVAIVDRSGGLQVFLRDRFAGSHTVTVAQNKAWTSASFKQSTTEIGKATRAGQAESGIRFVDRVMVNGGGLPVTAAGSLVGAIGVSGAPGGEADEACAHAGIDVIAEDLEF
ncbi:MAG: heme-binding protein [Burkholderiaceae bacterium]